MNLKALLFVALWAALTAVFWMFVAPWFQHRNAEIQHGLDKSREVLDHMSLSKEGGLLKEVVIAHGGEVGLLRLYVLKKPINILREQFVADVTKLSPGAGALHRSERANRVAGCVGNIQVSLSYTVPATQYTLKAVIDSTASLPLGC